MFYLVGALTLRFMLQSRALRRASGDAAAWRSDTERTLARSAMLAAFALAALDLLRLWHQTYAFYGGFEPITRQLLALIANETLWGSGWKLQVISASVAGICLAAAYRAWAASWPAAAAAVALTTVARPLTGHAVEQGNWLALPAILQIVHVTGAAVWIGTLFAVAAVGLRRAHALPARRAFVVVALVNGFSPLALGAATALFLAGAATSFLYLGSPAAVVATSYGRVLAAKFVAFGAVVAAGYFNWRRVKPRLAVDIEDQEPSAAHALLLRSAAAELAVAALVLLLTAALVALPLPTG